MSFRFKTGNATIINGESTVVFATQFSDTPTVICSPKLKDINIFIKNITKFNFVVSASSSETFDISYIAILKK